MEYNTSRKKISIPEYGRNVHKMIEYTMTIPEKEKRNSAARQIISVMGQLTAYHKDGGDFRQKLWDHLFIISDYKLDIDSPYPIPSPSEEVNKIQKPSYPHQNITFKQYGKCVEKMIEKVIAYEEGPEKETLTRYIANHLKKMYLNWNRDTVQDGLIAEHLSSLSGGKLVLSEDTKLETTIDIIARNKKKKYPSNGKQHNQKNYSNYRKKTRR